MVIIRESLLLGIGRTDGGRRARLARARRSHDRVGPKLCVQGGGPCRFQHPRMYSTALSSGAWAGTYSSMWLAARYGEELADDRLRRVPNQPGARGFAGHMAREMFEEQETSSSADHHRNKREIEMNHMMLPIAQSHCRLT